MKLSRAFSLVELLVVVAVIAILTAVAMPVYSTYLVKARVTEMLVVADSYKLKLAENLFFTDNVRSIDHLNTNIISHVAVDTIPGQPPKQVIEVVAKMQDNDQTGIGLSQPTNIDSALTIQLHGTQTGDVISWTCHVASVYNKFVPRNCQNNDLENLNFG